MSLEITGKLTTLLEQQTGNGRNGTWTKRDFVIETTENYPKQICFSVWGDKVAELNTYQIGESLKISFDPSSREFNGRWYTELKAWKIDRQSAGQAAGQPSGQAASSTTAPPAPSADWLDSLPASENADDLPF